MPRPAERRPYIRYTQKGNENILKVHMERFINDDFLLTTETARRLYHHVAAEAPIVDYHCHVSPREIYEDRRFDTITEVWLSGDHYKWRLMRTAGVEERYITGDAPDREKFQKFAECLPRAIGNPMFHWCHLELKRYFGYEGVLNSETAQEVWDRTSSILREGLSVRQMILQSGVTFIGTTDDPIDTLEWHEKLAADETFPVTVVPSFRPDKVLNMDKPGWRSYIEALAQVAGHPVRSMDDLRAVLSARIHHFVAHGCRSADHGLDRAVYREASEAELENILQKALRGEAVTPAEVEAFKTALLLFCAKAYTRHGMVMQLHYNCLRNPNTAAFAVLGPDSGFDCVGQGSSLPLARLLDTLYRQDSLPKTILYSLDAGDDSFLDSLIGAFQGAGVRGKLQHGAAWWFNDHKAGMRRQLISLASLSLLGDFVGMLTDSRSFLSYTRHEYFRRILCDLIGQWVEVGEYPDDEATLRELVRNICCDNAIRYFGLEESAT